MQQIFVFIFLIGLVSLVTLILIAANPYKASSYRQQLHPSRLINRLQSQKLQEILDHAGIDMTAKFYNLFRWGAAITYLVFDGIERWIDHEAYSFRPFLIALLWIVCTSPLRYAPIGWLFRKLQFNRMIKKNGELISFLRLYANNRLKQRGYVQLSAFCDSVADYFKLIGKDIKALSLRLVEDDTEPALDWFVGRFPKNHPFIKDIRSIVLAAESFNHAEEAREFLKQQNESIANISRDQYASRWKFIGELANIFNTIPSILTTLMLLVLVLIHITISKGYVVFN